jgi:hypothetical protein
MHRSEMAGLVSQPSTEMATERATRAPAPSQHSLTHSRLTPLVASTHQTLAIAHVPRAESASPPAASLPSFEPVIAVEPNVEHPVDRQDETEAGESANLTSWVVPPTNLSVSHTTLDEQPRMDVSPPQATAASAIPSTPFPSSTPSNPPPTPGSEAKLIEEPSVPPQPRGARSEQTHEGVAPLPIRPTAETTTTSPPSSVQPATPNLTSMSQLSGESDRQPPVSSVSQPSVQPATPNLTSMSQLSGESDRQPPVSSVSQPSVQPATPNLTSMSQLSGESDRQPPVSSVSQPSVQPATPNLTSMSQLLGESDRQPPGDSQLQNLPSISESISQPLAKRSPAPIQPFVEQGNPSLIPQVDREVTRSPQTSTVTPQAVPRPPIGVESAQANQLNPPPSVTPLVPQAAPSVNPRIEANSSRWEASFTPRSAQGQEPQSVTPSQPEPTPTIHITIGRIDIRAVPASTPTRPRATATPPKQSLQDYLNSRNGGRG